LTTPQQKNVDKRPIASLLHGDQTLAYWDTRRSLFPLAPRVRPLLDIPLPMLCGESCRLVCVRCTQPRRLGAVGERSALVWPFDLALAGVAVCGGSRRLAAGAATSIWSGPYPVFCP